MAANIDAGSQARAAATSRLSKSRGDRAQVAATLRWLRELRPVQRPPVTRRTDSTTS